MKKYAYFAKLVSGIWMVFFLIKDFDVIRFDIISVLKLWAGTLIPSLFPYLVISGYLISSGALTVFNYLLFPLQKLFKISSDGISVYICSLFCGYPSGAVCTSELYKNGSISKNEAERLICFTNNASPLFLVAAVGECILGSGKDGFFIYLIQIISAMITGLILSFVCTDSSHKYYYQKTTTPTESKSFCECCQNSVNTILAIGGYGVISTVLASVTMLTIEKLLPIHIGTYKWVVYGLFEISSGISNLSAISSSITYPTLCALITWSGISVILQIKSVLPKDVSIKQLVYSKFFQAITSFFLGMCYKNNAEICSFNPQTHTIIKASLIISIIIFVSVLIIRLFKKSCHILTPSRHHQ